MAIDQDGCERFEIIQVAGDAGRYSMLFGRLTSGSPPTYQEVGKAPCPFRELFVAVPAGESVYFVTATGKLYFSKRDKKGVPEKIVRVPLSFGVRIEGVLIDTRSGKSFVFSNWDSQALLAGEYPKFKPRGKPTVPLPADPFDFALAMRS